ncbi:DUF2290 domain-containing protein [Bacillus sp. 03113]|uniref:DUF2290 domain-containing protein n=1 Tax=Bacillus sp. 03113 TaxID=2578211 RepID=UPI0011448DE9|nr:DUF2290 domain-containing protein [Bacillus sp. 03113]
MSKKDIVNMLLKEYIMIYSLLYEKRYIIEHRELSHSHTGKDMHELTWSGRNQEANVTFDTSLEITPIIDTLLQEEQFSFLFYDKSIMQVEYKIKSNEIVKQRLQFIKKSSRVRAIEEIQQLEGEFTEVEGSNWFEEESGIPVFLRVDYDPDNHEDVYHAKSHFVISNIKDCRIPMKCNLSLVKFVELILHQIYNEYDLSIKDILGHKDEITQNEKLVMHLDW